MVINKICPILFAGSFGKNPAKCVIRCIKEKCAIWNEVMQCCGMKCGLKFKE